MTQKEREDEALECAEFLQSFCKKTKNCSECIFWGEYGCIIDSLPEHYKLSDCRRDKDE